MTREEILAIRATGLALVAQCDAALERLATSIVVAHSNAVNIFNEPCPHPTVISTAVSGLPNRKKCTACGETVYQIQTHESVA